MDGVSKFFALYFTVITVLVAAPGPFDWANRIDPFVLGLPFSIFWVLFMAVLSFAGFFAWYGLDAKNGGLDIK